MPLLFWQGTGALCRWVFIERLVATNVDGAIDWAIASLSMMALLSRRAWATYKAPLIEASRLTLGGQSAKICLANSDEEEVRINGTSQEATSEEPGPVRHRGTVEGRVPKYQ